MNNMKEFVKTWSNKKELKNLTKEERIDYMYNSLDDIVDFFLFKRFKEKETISKLYDAMENPKFYKTLKKVIKICQEENTPDASICIVIQDFLTTRKESLVLETLDAYKQIMVKLIEKPVKKISKETSLNAAQALKIVSNIPSKRIVRNAKYVKRYVQTIENNLFYLVTDEKDPLDVEAFGTSTIRFIVKTLMEKEFQEEVVLSICLDKKSIIENFTEGQFKIWNTFSDYALEYMENMNKEDLVDLLIRYCKEREHDYKEHRDTIRRFNFKELPKEDYKKIYKACKFLIKNDENGKFEKYL